MTAPKKVRTPGADDAPKPIESAVPVVPDADGVAVVGKRIPGQWYLGPQGWEKEPEQEA